MANVGRTHYEVLEVPRTASPQQIRSAYRRLARRYHPDANAGGDSRARFEELATAYEVLHDPLARARYDRSTVPTPQSPPAFSTGRAARDVPRFVDDELQGAHRVAFRVQVVVRMPFGFRWPRW